MKLFSDAWPLPLGSAVGAGAVDAGLSEEVVRDASHIASPASSSTAARTMRRRRVTAGSVGARGR